MVTASGLLLKQNQRGRARSGPQAQAPGGPGPERAQAGPVTGPHRVQ